MSKFRFYIDSIQWQLEAALPPINPFCRNLAHSVIVAYIALLNSMIISSMVYFKRKFTIGPHQANLVLIAYASSEGSDEPAHARSLARTSAARSYSESRGTFRQKARSLAPLNDWACAVKICHDGMLEDINSLDGAQLVLSKLLINSLQNVIVHGTKPVL